MLFHGTPKVNDIIKHGFDKSETNPKGMFGGGFYFADLSSKANQYVLEDMHCGDHNRQSCQAYLRKLLLCRVLLGNTEKRTQSESYDTAPPYHHSITAVPSDKGLRYKEYVVYKNKQIYPEVVITYKIKQ
ncbi:unnamed protein product [Clavelina lepadiformis]|uniref:Poly [ADP-ribose] polymerase n=1 Tax=Clavelina lepadiformis TaxID=159417 RepID=A0ABP0F709_CLALP